MNGKKEYAAELLDELQRHGICDAFVEQHSAHPRIRFTHNGRPMFFVFPSSPSDMRGRGLDNALSDLRRLIGVKKIVHKSTAPPKKRNKTSPETALTFSIKPNPLQSLVVMQHRIVAAKRDVKADGILAFMSGASDAPPTGLSDYMTNEFRQGWWYMHKTMGVWR